MNLAVGCIERRLSNGRRERRKMNVELGEVCLNRRQQQHGVLKPIRTRRNSVAGATLSI